MQEVYFFGGPADLSEYDQRVSDGDFLVLPEFGKSFKILRANLPTSTGFVPNITANTVLGPVGSTTALTGTSVRRVELTAMPDLSAAGTVTPTTGTPSHNVTLKTYKFGFQRGPQPLLGEPALQLTGGTAIDFRTETLPANPYKTSFGGAAGPYNPPTSLIGGQPTTDPVTGGFTFDILFTPSGQLLNANSAGLLCLWVRDTTKSVANPRLDPATGNCDPYSVYDTAGQQVFVVVNAKNGLISTQEVVPPPPGSNPANYDPYRYTRDGLSSGL